jgi:hypothetical protein
MQLIFIGVLGWGIIGNNYHGINEQVRVVDGSVMVNDYSASVIVDGKEIVHVSKDDQLRGQLHKYTFLKSRENSTVKVTGIKGQNIYKVWEG